MFPKDQTSEIIAVRTEPVLGGSKNAYMSVLVQKVEILDGRQAGVFALEIVIIKLKLCVIKPRSVGDPIQN